MCCCDPAVFMPATVQTVAVTPATVADDSMLMHVRVDTVAIAAPSAVTLPAPVLGKEVTVKDFTGAALAFPITVAASTGAIVGVAVVAAAFGALTFRCVDAVNDIWDTI